jgi:hypothetical protein
MGFEQPTNMENREQIKISYQNYLYQPVETESGPQKMKLVTSTIC